MAPVDHSKSNKPGGAKLKVTEKAIGGDSAATLVEGGSNGPQLRSKYGLRVIQPASASEGNKATWIKVKKVGSGNKGIGSGRTMATRILVLENEAIQEQTRPVDNKLNSSEVPAAKSGSGSAISITRRTNPTKVMQLRGRLEDRLEGYADGRQTSFMDDTEPPSDGNDGDAMENAVGVEPLEPAVRDEREADSEGPPMTIDKIFDLVLSLRSGKGKGSREMNEELHKQMEELKARQDGMEESIFDKLRAEMRQHYEEAGKLNPSWEDEDDEGNAQCAG
ncbi:hypothetical protein FNV43_RR01390 [Rhamnella rubrinervis]|uniref:Uncharacterized protein n=1 Tax=Rhamnella rubrinervis TaxID=2594499 RepID=A0A8K0HPJ2_9ROSA|nr:hypothetical protein FNV43_RR01390 [Rhamnella rubrinervis]